MTISLTKEQSEALSAILAFMQDDEADIFVLRGSAGTGKTTIISEIVKALQLRGKSCAAMAPTGRAARILGEKLERTLGGQAPECGTIHRTIFQMGDLTVNEEATDVNDPGMRMIFALKTDEPSAALMIIDESSMVGDMAAKGDVVQFGSGRLLSDLINYVRMNREGRANDHITKLLFVGDPAQLPPVTEPQSPALDADYLQREFRATVRSFDLRQVLRQQAGSAVLAAATRIRDALQSGIHTTFDIPQTQGEIESRSILNAIEEVAQGYERGDSRVAIVYSNAAALDYNRSIRARLWGEEQAPVRAGDTLLVNRNSTLYPLNNGDLVRVQSIAREVEAHSIAVRGAGITELRFRRAEVITPSGAVVTCSILENLLDSPSRDLSPVEQRALLVFFRQRNPNLKPKDAAFRLAIRTDAHVNALQVKFGYAMTCHKAQGGEWDTAIVDFSTAKAGQHESFFRWAYTAITRARSKLMLVQSPSFSPVSTLQWSGFGAPHSLAAPAPVVQVSAPITVEQPPAPAPLVQVSAPITVVQPPALAAVVQASAPSMHVDWATFSFPAGAERLFAFHLRLREAWAHHGIEVERVEHLQYRERYHVGRNGQQVCVEYAYKKDLQPSNVTAGPAANADGELLKTALDAAHRLSGGAAASAPDATAALLLAQIDAALASSLIQRTSVAAFPYRLRVGLSDGVRNGSIDFSYNGKGQWTGATEVGGPNRTNGLYQEVQILMQATGAQ